MVIRVCVGILVLVAHVCATTIKIIVSHNIV